MYKLTCDKCKRKPGSKDRKGDRVDFFAYRDPKTGKDHGRCRPHLTKK